MISIGLFCCTRSQTENSLLERTSANQFSVATVLEVDFEDKGFAECVQNDLEKKLSNLKFIPGDRFRDALFPWFEPSNAPKKIDEFSAIMDKTLVRDRIEAIGIELLIYVHGHTYQEQIQLGQGVAYGFGYQDADRETHIWTKVWDLKNNVDLGDTDVNIQGTVKILWFFAPIPIPVFTERAACSETAKQITERLINNNPLKDK